MDLVSVPLKNVGYSDIEKQDVKTDGTQINDRRKESHGDMRRRRGGRHRCQITRNEPFSSSSHLCPHILVWARWFQSI